MAELGNKNRVYRKTTNGSTTTYTAFAGESTNSITLNGNPIDVSDKSSTWQRYIQGMCGGTASMALYADNSDTEQKAVLASLKAGNLEEFFIGQLENNTPSKGVAFFAVISEISDTNDNASAASRNVSMQISGEPTIIPA